MSDTHGLRGGWIPLCKALVSELPHRETRPFTKLEAMFSITVDVDNGAQVTVSGYASLWRWSEGKVRRFLDEIGATIKYPENTSKRQNQRGEIVMVMSERKRRDSGEIRLIDFKGLHETTEGKRRDNGEKTERSQRTTIDTDTEPITYVGLDGVSYPFESFFEKLWSVYPRKDGKKQAFRHYKATVKTVRDMHDIKGALERYLEHVEGKDPQYTKNGSTWFCNWGDWRQEDRADA